KRQRLCSRVELLGGANSACLVSAARFGGVAHIGSISRRIEDQLVHTGYVTLAKGNDLEFLASGLTHNLLNRDRSSRRSVFFLRLMALENLTRVLVFQRNTLNCSILVEKVYTVGNIRCEENATF